MQEQIQKQIDQHKLQVKDLENTMSALYRDTNIIPDLPIPYAQGKFRLTRGSKVSDSRCEAPFEAGGCGALGGDYFARQKEKRIIAEKKHIAPLQRNKEKLQKEIKQLELKSTLPHLRNELLSNVSQFQTLEKTDPQFRQKQTDLKKSIFEQSAKVDELENQFNWFANIPSLKPEIITPDPVVRTKTELGAINTRPLIIGGIIGLAALFLIWRFK